MGDKVREALEELNARLKGQFPYLLEMVDPKDIKLLDKNARYMTNEMFENLVGNIKKDGNLSSLPLCHRDEAGTLTVLSGNHRVQAAAKAGVGEVLVLVLEGDLSRGELVAIQLSHNAISGKDDPVLLAALWDDIDELKDKVYAGLDTDLVKKLEGLQFDSIAEARIDFKVMSFLFLPEEVDKLKRVLERVNEVFAGDGAFLAARNHYDDIFAVIVKAKDGYDIFNNPTALMKMVALAEAQMEGLEPTTT